MEAVAAVSGPLTGDAMARLARGEDMRGAPEPLDKAGALARLDGLLRRP